MTGCIQIVIHIALAALAGVGGITLLGAGGSGDFCFVIMIDSGLSITVATCRGLPCSKTNKSYFLTCGRFYICNGYTVCRFWRAEGGRSPCSTQTKSKVFIVKWCKQFSFLVIEATDCVSFAQEEHILNPYAITRCYRNQIRRSCSRGGFLHPLIRALGNG